MNVVILGAAFVLCGTGFAIVFAKLIPRGRGIPLTEDEQFLLQSGARYRAMERLLDSIDSEFIASHQARAPQLLKNFRRRRVAIFRGYMRQLSADFSAISRAIRAHMVSSGVDRTSLTGVIMKEQFRFGLQMFLVEIRLVQYSLGWRTVDTSGLLRCLEHMREQLQALNPVTDPAAA